MNNRIKFDLQNLANIINQGNLDLVNFKKKQHVISSQQKYDTQNKLHMDQQGKLYIQKKDGRRIYKLQKQEYGLMPRFCPNCNRMMGKHTHDSFFWKIHNLCAKCSIIKQQQMRDQGTFNIFALNYMKDKLVDTCNQAIQFYQQSKIQNQRHIVINQQGQIQKWATQNPQQFRDAVDKTIKQIQDYRDQAIQYFQQRILQQEKTNRDE